MMKEKDYEALYTQGYNQGYLLSRFEPDLYKKVIQAGNTEQPYFKGMQQGHQQCQRELFLANLKNSRKLNEQMKNRPSM